MTCDLLEYDFKKIYKTFNVSYFSKDDDLIGDKFADSEHLKHYESIEKSTNNLMVILIRKFKLRISFRKNNDFSKQIIISDDYDFEPDRLKFEDSIIKIAIVKDDFDKWTNLSEYDYIFTFKDYVNELKQYGTVLPIAEDSLFNQIKFILNDLYRHKANKFYYFLKNVDFLRVFPKWNDYFKVFNSEFFDEQWYRDTYKLSKNTDSVIHFLLIGHEKGYNPGPHFNTHEYYECNKDVEKEGINPLVHYEVYGRKENRIYQISDIGQRDYSLISNSSFFDKEWYKSTYGIDEDPINHYLNVGFTKTYNPGPNFSTFEYLECNRDVREMGMNPLVHYELIGRKIKRKLNLDVEIRQKYLSAISDSSFYDGEWYRRTYALGDDIDCVSHFLDIGFAIGYDPSPDFSTREYYECNKDVEDYGMNPLLHYELYGKNENRMIWVKDIIERDHSCILNSRYFDDGWYRRTYDLGDDVDCADHYLNVGFAEGYNPGPNFSTYEYWECNLDIKEWVMNPLLHYELYGKRENRLIEFSKDVSRNHYSHILESDYFDCEWYRSAYGLGADVDCVDHYLKIGYVKDYDPSPDFSTREYYDCNKDVEDYGMNPLLHYEMYGQYENRPIHYSDMIERDYNCIRDSVYFDSEWYRRTYNLGDDVDCADHYLNIGFKKNYDPSPNFSTIGYYQQHLTVKEWGMNPLLHYELYGK